MMKVSNEISIDVNLDPKLLLKKYEKDIRELKQELAMHDTLANRGRISYEPYTPEQQYKQQQLAQDYLDSKIDDIPFDSLRQVRELFVQFRNIYKAAMRDQVNNSGPRQ
jgi:kinesin family protein 6/9